MSLSVEQRGDVRVVRLGGDLGMQADLTDLLSQLVDQLSGRGSRLVVDLAAVAFINSTAISALVRLVAQANLQEGRVILAALQPSIAGMLEMTRLNQFFDVAPTVDEAVSRLAQR